MPSPTLPECAATAVTGHLIAAGFPLATPGEFGPGWNAGVYIADLPTPEPRVAVYFWPNPIDSRAEEVAKSLRDAGYQVERVVDHPRDYLVVWTEGDF